jgi:hypothetical protein
LSDATCSVIEHGERCGDPVNSHGWCTKHYRRWQRNGDPLTVKQIVGDDRARLMSHVRQGTPDECWPWTGAVGDRGYGVTKRTEGETLAHRAIYAVFVGPIPEGATIDHLCHKHDECDGGDECPHRKCCNWLAHLKVAPGVANMMRGNGPSAINARKDRCIRGHLFDEANTIRSRSGKRRCRKCRQTYRRERRAAGLAA